MDSDSLSGLFFYLLVVSPILSWILKPGRFSERKGQMYAVGFLALIGGTTIYLKIQEQNANFYHILNVNRDTSMSDIKRAYRARSIDLHPDKNPSPRATEEFNRLRMAYDVLHDADRRRVYELFGEKAATAKTLERNVIEDMVGVLSYYIISGLIAYILTLGESEGNARSWIYVGGLVMLLIEMNLKFSAEIELPIMPGLAQTTTSEFLSLMKSVFPVFLNGCRTMAPYFSTNMLEDNFQLSLALLHSNQAILRGLRDIHIEVQGMQRQSGGKAVTTVQGIRKRSKLDKQNKITDDGQEVLGTEEEKLMKRTSVIQDPPRAKIPSFVYAIAFYFVMNYFFSA